MKSVFKLQCTGWNHSIFTFYIEADNTSKTHTPPILSTFIVESLLLPSHVRYAQAQLCMCLNWYTHTLLCVCVHLKSEIILGKIDIPFCVLSLNTSTQKMTWHCKYTYFCIHFHEFSSMYGCGSVFFSSMSYFSIWHSNDKIRFDNEILSNWNVGVTLLVWIESKHEWVFWLLVLKCPWRWITFCILCMALCGGFFFG